MKITIPQHLKQNKILQTLDTLSFAKYVTYKPMSKRSIQIDSNVLIYVTQGAKVLHLIDSDVVLSNLMPKGAIQSITDYKKFGYGGACPPVGHGAHQYLITIYALDTQKLGIDKGANPALAGFMINSHTIAKASIVAYYAR